MTEERRRSDPRADDVRQRYCEAFGAPDVIPVPIERIAVDLLGLWIEEVDGLGVSGVLIPGERLILVNRDEPPVRKRFTVAHEVGHWVCQCDEGRGAAPAIMCRGADLDEAVEKGLEREANRFAATLLMPDAFVTGDIAANAAETLAEQFQVSLSAIEWRLWNAGLTSMRPEPQSTGRPDGDAL